MNCEICGEPTIDRSICNRCSGIMNKVVKAVNPDILKNVDNCAYIYPMIKRVVEGSLRTEDVINELLKGETD